jgi:hypothetical protein
MVVFVSMVCGRQSPSPRPMLTQDASSMAWLQPLAVEWYFPPEYFPLMALYLVPELVTQHKI